MTSTTPGPAGPALDRPDDTDLPDDPTPPIFDVAGLPVDGDSDPSAEPGTPSAT